MFTNHFLMLFTPWLDRLLEKLEFANYPGLELWKFLDLAIFIFVGIFILRKPISGALTARAEKIRQELEAAKAENVKAGQKLAEAESLLAKVDSDVNEIRAQAEQEAEAEDSGTVPKNDAALDKALALLKAKTS